MSSTKPKILVQLDTGPHPSVFDSVVAVDSGVAHLFRIGDVTPENVRDHVYGALFTRGPADLHQTALFVGGPDVAAGAAVLAAIRATFFAPFQVSVLFDSNGCNTTAAAAVLAALAGMGGTLDGVATAVLGATGPVGQRVARLFSRLGATVAVGSRGIERAEAVAESLRAATGGAFTPFASANPDDLAQGLAGAAVVVASGAAGALVLPESVRRALPDLKVAIDLNAVPPLGIEGVKATDQDVERDGLRVWGALGVGGTKMKIHKKALQELFTANDKVLDAEEVFALGQSLP